MLEVPFPLGS